MPDNLYQNPEQGSAFGAMLGMGAWLGTDLAYNYASNLVPEGIAATTLGHRKYFQLGRTREGVGGTGRNVGPDMAQMAANKAKYERKGFFGWNRRRMARARVAGQYSRAAWRGFLQPGLGWDVSARYKAAGAAMEGMPGVKAGAAKVGRALFKAPLGFASAYFMWGSLIPAAVDMGLGMFQSLAAEGAQLRRRSPELVSNTYDAATRQQAFTMRQASSIAMHQSQLGIRASLSHEADFLHS